MTQPTQGERKRVLKAARGRGNQGDWATRRGAGGEMREHKDWNAEVEAKKAAKKARRDV